MLNAFLPIVIATVVSLIGLMLLHYVLIARRTDLSGEALLPRQLILLLASLLAVIVLIVLAPAPESTRNQILGLLGILISGVIAFSSTAFVTNFMAAIMLRVTHPFSVGDFITLGDRFGKVSARGLFDTEIQTETGELIAIPNALFISQPVKVVHKTGMIISTRLSLGYDVHRVRIEELLLSAAKQTELTDPYVHIIELGDFSITYQVSGFLVEPKTLLTSRSKLNAKVLDTLHGAGIEIVSPNFARHISHPEQNRMIPVNVMRDSVTQQKTSAEDVAFAKANLAEAAKLKKSELKKEIEAVTEMLESGDLEDKDPLKSKRDRLREELKALEKEESEPEDK